MRKRKQTAGRRVFRYLAGHPLDGYPRSNSTFLKPGTEPAPGELPGAWSLLAGWQRSVIRTAPPILLVVLAYNWAYHREWTVAVLVGLAVAGGARMGDAAVRWFLLRRHLRTYVGPLARTLSRELGVAHRRAGSLVHVPLDYKDEDAEPVRITLPADRHLSPELKERIRSMVSQRLGLHDATENWATIGPAPVATFRPAPRPPARVGWADVADAIAAAPENAPVLGIGHRATVVDTDFDADSPHIGVSAGTGAGKSVLVGNIAVHALHHGAGIIVFDYKRNSQKPIEGLPGVRIIKDIDQIHEWAIRIGEECKRRNVDADKPGGFNGHRILVVIEEWNALAPLLQIYWEEIRDKNDPKRSPAISGLASVAFMGRHILMNLIGIAQMLTAQTTGGGPVRENMGTRCLARYTKNAWKMLADVDPIPKRSKHTGRWQIVKGGEAIETQVAFLLEKVDGEYVLCDEAREWALSGVANPVEVLSQGPRTAPTLGNQPGTVPASQPATPTPVGLREAADSGIGATLDQLRAWRKRYPDVFPQPVRQRGQEDLYDIDALTAFVRRRAAISIVKGDVA